MDLGFYEGGKSLVHFLSAYNPISMPKCVRDRSAFKIVCAYTLR